MGYINDVCGKFIRSKTIWTAFYFFRIQILKTSFENNIYHTVDYEEHIFTSEVWWTSVSFLFLIIFQFYQQISVLTFFPKKVVILSIVLMPHKCFYSFSLS